MTRTTTYRTKAKLTEKDQNCIFLPPFNAGTSTHFSKNKISTYKDALDFCNEYDVITVFNVKNKDFKGSSPLYYGVPS